MTGEQGYVSDELTHFVGRGKTTGNQYNLLVNKILKTGWLMHAPFNPSIQRTVDLDLSKPISTDEMIKYQVVCFCDIPKDKLTIHVGKYSRFGLAFKKPYLIDKGACPVFYAANEAPVAVKKLFALEQYKNRIAEARKEGKADRALLFDTAVKALFDILRGFDGLNPVEDARYFKKPADEIDQSEMYLRQLLNLDHSQLSSLKAALANNAQAFETLRMFADFLCNHVFSFTKCFDAKRSFEDASHFYMEREWRLPNNLNFQLSDVCRIFLPSKYEGRFRTDMPSYGGEITSLD
jgi:hypothetical protein